MYVQASLQSLLFFYHSSGSVDTPYYQSNRCSFPDTLNDNPRKAMRANRDTYGKDCTGGRWRVSIHVAREAFRGRFVHFHAPLCGYISSLLPKVLYAFGSFRTGFLNNYRP